jgi:predicted pyridoxine 5'-phosphate oxidase superfamily flavin-nucleotide-binding protein
MSADLFHADELWAQERAGGLARGAAIRDFMPEPHRNFFAGLPEIFIAGVDANGWPLATLLEDHAGFIQSPDPTTLRVSALPAPGDPASATLRVGSDIGLLGIDLATRRRNRANGVVAALDGAGFTVAVRQSFGNCPQYIQRRLLERRGASGTVGSRSFESLDGAARSLIARADTFFVASRSRSGFGARGGADISHRGGRPGFVRVQGNTLAIPDFRGNGYFNTLGNLIGEPRCSLLFVDFEQGDVLQLQGLADIDWASSFPGAQREWHVRIARGWHRAGAAALRGPLLEYSPVTLRTGIWG